VVAPVLGVGRVFADDGVRDAHDRLALALARSGYALAEVHSRVERPDSFSVVPVFDVTAGGVQRFGSLTVEGLPEDLEDLALKTLGVPAGARYSPTLVSRARDNLRELQLFRRIRLATAAEAPGVLRLTADLAAAAPRTARVSLGSWSDDPIRLSGEWRHRNRFRYGRGLGFHGALSFYHRELGARIWWPALLGPRSVVELVEDEDSYTLENRLIEAAVLLRPVGRLSLRFGASLEDVLVTGTGLDRTVFTEPDGRQLVFSTRLHDDHADDVLYPTRGARLGLDLAWSPPGALSVAPFASAEAQVVVYAPLPAGVVLASRLAVGVARPLGDSESLLPNRRFFAGGVTTQRGYKRRRLGPVDGDDDPIGGQARLLASRELRVPAMGWLDLTAFIDAGQVWSDRADLGTDDLAVALGGGLVVHTPVGPVRTDLARLTAAPRAGEPRTVFHLAIGHPF
jgi:outer membrane translocation and assembly module TamA